jgi:prepilin-type N-terminal cleavage/methylation domain-containing protein
MRTRADVRARRQAGFTLMEVLVALLVFAISVVGLVALESRAIESQRAAALIRDGERAAQDAMAELMSRGFVDLLDRDFAGNQGPNIPYDDAGVDPDERLRGFRTPPADQPATDVGTGGLRNTYLVVRTVDWVVDDADPPSNPPVLGDDEQRIGALVLDVLVMWIDDTNPTLPPPATLAVTDLVPAMVDPADPDYRPYVGHVRLRTIRSNDAFLAAGAP